MKLEYSENYLIKLNNMLKETPGRKFQLYLILGSCKMEAALNGDNFYVKPPLFASQTVRKAFQREFREGKMCSGGKCQASGGAPQEKDATLVKEEKSADARGTSVGVRSRYGLRSGRCSGSVTIVLK